MDIVVIKVGSLLLTNTEGRIDINNLRNLSFQIADLKEKYSIQVILVSSGAIACGSEAMGFKAQSIPEKQAAAAVGQPLLINQYQQFFREKGVKIAQLLLTKDGFHQEDRKTHALNTLSTLMKQNVVPIINENDSVAIDEICFGDNDHLASEVAILIKAKKLLLLSNVDGLYSGNPDEPGSTLIRNIQNIDDSFIQQFESQADQNSSGGIRSKLLAAKRLLKANIDTYIANGRTENIIEGVLSGTAKCTHIQAH